MIYVILWTRARSRNEDVVEDREKGLSLPLLVISFVGPRKHRFWGTIVYRVDGSHFSNI